MPLFLCPMRVKPALAVDLGSTIRTSYRNRHRNQTKLGTWVRLTVWGFPLFVGESHFHPRGTQEVSIPGSQSFLPRGAKEEVLGSLCSVTYWRTSVVWSSGDWERQEDPGRSTGNSGCSGGREGVFPPSPPTGCSSYTHARSPHLSFLREADCHHRESLSVCHLRYSHTGKRLKRVEHKEERELVKDIFISLCFLLFYVYM